MRAVGLRTPPPVRGALESRKASPILPGAVLLTEEGKQTRPRGKLWGGCGKGVEPRDRPSPAALAEKQRPAPIAVGYREGDGPRE